MKNSIIKTVIILIGLGFTINERVAASDVNIPEKVTAAFIATYPQAKLKDWKIANEGYKAEFKFNHRKCIAVYAADGTLLKRETKLNRTQDMPLAVKTALMKGKYAAYHVDEIKEVNTGGAIHYALTIDNHDGSTMPAEGYGAWEDYHIIFNDNGTITGVKVL